MRSIFSALLAAGCLWAAGCGRNAATTSAPAPGGDNASKDKEPAFGVKNIDGRYKVIGVSIEGMWIPEEEIAKEAASQGTEVIKDGSWETEGGKALSTTRFKIDPSKTPAEIDFTVTRGKVKKEEEVQLGIYKVEGDVLTVSRGRKDRPKNFEPAKEVMIMKYKRQ